jgi:hypothetical protein
MSLIQPASKVGSFKRVCKSEIRIAQNFEGQMQTLRHFALIIGCPCTQAKYFGLKAGEFTIVVAKSAGLGCAATRAWHQIPFKGTPGTAVMG